MGRRAAKAAGKTLGKKVIAEEETSAADARRADKASKAEKVRIIPFYSDKPGKKYREFSNFFGEAPAFEFVLPAFSRREGWPVSCSCEFSEKAIMLTKAALMDDREAFDEIARAFRPDVCKKLGRSVQNFNEKLWQQHLEETAFEVVRQKFAASRPLREVLMSTGYAILAEAAPNDSIWGIGLRTTDERSMDPAQWCGRNVLGFALMRARAFLRGESLSNDEARALAGLKTAPTSEEQSIGMSENFTMPLPCDREEQNSTILEMPEQEEDFLRPVTDLEAVKSCFERYGVVGVTGVLSPEECEALVREGFEPELPDGCRMDQPDTFGLADANMNRYGVVGKSALFSKALLEARLHPHVVAAYQAVHGRQDVFAAHDRFAWMRPAESNKAWDTPFTWPGLHFDVSLQSYFGPGQAEVDDFLAGCDYDKSDGFLKENNAKHESMGRTVQGVLNIFENAEENGGFQCVPGFFGQALKDWVASHPSLPAPEANGRYNLGCSGPDSKLGAQAVRVPCPAGTLILFDATLPHGTRPNASSCNRAILFLRYLTSDELPLAAWRRRNAALRRVAKDAHFEADERQKKHMYGPE